MVRQTEALIITANSKALILKGRCLLGLDKPNDALMQFSNAAKNDEKNPDIFSKDS